MPRGEVQPDARVELGAADARVRLASVDLARGVLLGEAWILAEDETTRRRLESSRA